MTANRFICFILREKVHPGDLARGCSDLEMTWLLCCAGAATVYKYCLVFVNVCAPLLHEF